jgi:CHAT domain-containing protein
VLAQGDRNEDGLLEAWELMRMDLRADLVVLSACETARGRFGAGEGVIGLSWAMFVAGAPATVVSQWKVESASTRELMLGFHQRLIAPSRKPETKAEALRLAALKLMKNPATSHPFYWAGFVLVGDGR